MEIYVLLVQVDDWETSKKYEFTTNSREKMIQYIRKNFKRLGKFKYRNDDPNGYNFTYEKSLEAYTDCAYRNDSYGYEINHHLYIYKEVFDE